MANTFTKIASTAVGSGGVSNIEFTSIPSTYTDLCLMYSIRTNRSDFAVDEMFITFNGNATNYSSKTLVGAGGSASSGSGGTTQINKNWGDGNTGTSNTFSNQMIYIPNYAGSNYKSASLDGVAENNNTTEYWLYLTAGLWSNTSAITSIKMVPEVGSLILQYSTATLYGISNS